MYKKIFLFITLALLVTQQSYAVLKERNVDNTLAVLRHELVAYHADLEEQSGSMKNQQKQVFTNVVSVLNKSQQNSLMLYSQRSGYVFDLTYACHAATEQYKKFQYNALPFRHFVENADVEIARYDSLINDLNSMYTAALSERAQIDRNVCLTLAVNIRRTLNEGREQMSGYIQMYDKTEQRLKNLNDYANLRYTEIQNGIFRDAEADYFTVLKNLRNEIRAASETISDKYKPVTKVHSDWDSRILLELFGIILVWGLLSIFINIGIIRFLINWLVKHHKLSDLFENVLQKREDRSPQAAIMLKRPYILMATTVVTFAIMIGILRFVWDQSFIVMACGLLVEYAWLLGVILFSLLIRLDGDQVKSGFRIYVPLVVMSFVVISYRIVLIPNMLVNLTLPPLLLLCTLWQWNVISRCKKDLPKSDNFYAYCTLFVLVSSVICSWSGYTLLAVELLIWWMMQLACILTITCISTVLRSYGNVESRQFFSAETPITRTWFFRFIYHAVLPSLSALSVILSIYWAADVFNLSDTSWRIFNMKLIDSPNFSFSLFGIVQVIVLYFIFSYFNHTFINLLRFFLTEHEIQRAEEQGRLVNKQMVNSRVSMTKNVIQVIIWGAWVLVCMAVFHINGTWFVVVSGGLSTGIGFAMKDILENIYYGIALMAGRIKVGDYIECDGTRGTVKSISYTSTMIEALDGSMIAFQNSQLFTKNYKNLTKNHGNELGVLPIGVAYGSDVSEVKQLLEEAVKSVEKKNYIKFLRVVFTGLGDSSLDFKILVWIDSRLAIYAKSDILEAAYNALNAANIEIPFPQRDVHIIKDEMPSEDELVKEALKE